MKRRFRVGFLSTLPPTKGISDYTLAFLSHTTADFFYECYVVESLAPDALYPGGDKVEHPSEYERLPNNVRVTGRLDYYNIGNWMRAGLGTQADVFHLHWWTPFLVIPYMSLMGALGLRRVKTVVTIHNVKAHENKGFHSIMTRLILLLADHVIVHTESGKMELVESMGVKESDISVIPHGILQPRSKANTDTTIARKELKIPKDKKIALFFGNIRHYKGLDTLIEAMSYVQKETQDVHLLVAGMPWIGAEEVRRMVGKRNLNDVVDLNLRFIHPNKLHLYFEAADVVVLPYRYFDAQTGVGAYALYFEKPLIVSDVGGLPRLVKNKIGLVPPEDPKALANSILTVLMNQEIREQMILDSKSLKKEYEWDSILEKTERIYRQLAGGK